MKKLFLALAIFLTGISLQGQEVFSGKIEYLMEVENNPMGSIHMDVTTDGSSFVLDMRILAIPASKVVYNANQNAGYVASLFNPNGKPQAAYIDPIEFNKPNEGLKIQKVKDEKGKHTINEYKCKKKLVYIKGHDEPVSIFYTTKIKGLKNKNMPNSDFQALVEGLIIRVINPTEKETVTITVQDIDFNEPSPRVFDPTIPNEYEEVSMEELNSQK